MNSVVKNCLILFVLINSLNLFSQDSKEIIFFDNFESYNVDEQLVCQNPEDWTTWDNLPCTYQDPYISDSIVWNEITSIVIVDSNDLVKPIDNYTEGRYRISFKMHVPEGYCGYFNTLQVFDGMNSKDGMQVFFAEGNAFIKCPVATDFNYTQNTWFENSVVIDLDNDHAKYFYNNQLIEEWQWSHGGSFSGVNELGGNEFYPWNNYSQGVAKFYIDDYKIEQLEPVVLLPPLNLNLETSGSDIILTWDNPYGGEWLHWDYGNTGNGIGTGGPFYIASKWNPTDLVEYDGFYLSKLKFFAQSNTCTYSLRVWIGENSPILIFEQDVPEFETFDWNEVILNSLVLIDASEELWFGYVCTSQIGEFPASCDDGPAIQYSGDMISIDGVSWVSLSADYGLDYNWNVAGFVSETTENKELATPLVNNKVGEQLHEFEPILYFNKKNDELKNIDNKYLQGYKIYHSYNWGSYIYTDFSTATTWTHEDLGYGHHSYYIRALYDEGVSDPSDTVSLFMTNMDENKRTDILISPNPAADILNIHTQSNLNTINIYDQYGKLAEIKENFNSNFYQLNTTKFNSGFYLLSIDTENGTFIERVIIK